MAPSQERQVADAHGVVHDHLRRLRTHPAIRTNNDLLVLSVLWTSGGTGLGTLADRVGMTAGGLNALIGRLEHGGLVRRRPVEDDARRATVVLTAEGRSLMRRTATTTP